MHRPIVDDHPAVSPPQVPSAMEPSFSGSGVDVLEHAGTITTPSAVMKGRMPA